MLIKQLNPKDKTIIVDVPLTTTSGKTRVE